MVEIVKLGMKKEDKVHEAACYSCETVFRFKGSEAKYTSDQRDGDFLTIDCPLCKRPVHVQAKAK